MAKLLLVEDDNNLREIYEARLQAEGYEIASAEDGEQALVVAKQFRPDLVISDVMMPKISGFEMLDILRNTPGLEHARVIMLTALGQAEDKARADSLKADRYLVKSQVTLEDIVKAAHELLDDVDSTATPSVTQVASPTTTEPVVAPTTAGPVADTPTATSVPEASDVAPAAPTTQDNDTGTAQPEASIITGEPLDVIKPPAPVVIDASESTPAPGVSAPDGSTVAEPIFETPPVAPADQIVTPVATSATATDDNASTDEPEPVVDTVQPLGTSDTPIGTAAAEQETVDHQIEDFITSTGTSAAPEEVEPAPTPDAEATEQQTPTSDETADDSLLADAAQSLATPSETTETPAAQTSTLPESTTTPVESTEPATEVTTDVTTFATADLAPTGPPSQTNAANDGVTIAGKKVIQPPASNPKPDLNELLARENARETGLGTIQPVVSDTTSEETQLTTPTPQQVDAAPAPYDDLDPNNIAL